MSEEITKMNEPLEGQPWLYPVTLTTNSYAVVFNTENRFLDRNIKAQISVNSGSVSPLFSNTNLDTYFDIGTSSSNSISITPKATTTNGYIATFDSDHAVTGTAAYYTIKTAVPAADNANADVTLYTTDGSAAGTNISSIVGTKATSEPTSGYYLAFKGSGRSIITTNGWITAGNLNTSTSNAKYFPITAANGTVTKTSATMSPTVNLTQSNIVWSDSNTSGISVTATGNATASITAQANITTAGYAPKVNNWKSGTLSIAAADTPATSTQYLIGVTVGSGKAFAITNSGATTITSGSTSAGTVTIVAKKTGSDASDTTANVVTNGLWQQATIKSPNTTATLGNPEYQSNGDNTDKFVITASGTIAKPTVSTAGYVNGDDTIGTRQIGSIDGIKVLNKITVGATITSGSSGTVTPVITRTEKPTNDTWTDAANGSATATKPTSGIYVQVDAAAVSKSIVVKGTVTSAGYGTTTSGQYSQASGTNITAGSAAAATKYIPIKTATPAFDGGGLTGTATATKGGTTCVISDTDNDSGAYFTTACTATRADVLYNGAISGWVTAANDAVALSTDSTALTSKTYYINSVTVAKDKKFSVTTAADTALQTNGTEDLDITNNAYRRVDIINNANGRIWIPTNKGDVYVQHPTSGSGNVWIRGNGESNDTKVVNNGTRVTTFVVNTNNTTVSGTTATRASATWGTGWITSGSITPATFASTATSGTTYVDISNTTSAPILNSGDYLYINRGYVDNLKISLAKLVPNDITGKTMAPANYILTGYAAFDGNGAAINGTMQIYDGTYTVT